VADFKAAVGNAEEAVKREADYVAGKPDGEGALEILRKLVEGSLP
jgi:hydroxymethylpyrimidine pyrophosphatase-like HAD family hydrolase